MSMAEPRRRKKWTLNPRGTSWAQDDNKYGQKLMEKMGWSKGSGLGREEQGITEHVSVKFKDDNKGIGFKGCDDEWIKHYEGFESVLASLNSQENATVNTSAGSLPDHNNTTKTSLESSSKASKARVHYHKFTRGKDLSRCSEDDLGCILGSKRAKQLAEVKTPEEEVTQPDDAVGTVEHSMGVTTIKGCSIQEYFAKKMEALRNGVKSQPQCQEGGNERVSEEAEGRPGFGASWDGGEDNSNSVAAEKEVGEKKKKKKKKQHVESSYVNDAEKEEKSDNCIDMEVQTFSNKKKKKKRKGVDISAVDDSVCEDNPVKPPKKLLNTNNEKDVPCKPVSNEKTHKNKKKKKYIDAAIEAEQVSDAVQDENNENTKIKKKKRKYLDVHVENSSKDSDVQEHHEVKKKKKKKKDKA